MAKIPKNLSDGDMLGNAKETLTFETEIFQEEKIKPTKVKPEKKNYASEFFTPELQEKVGKALLELKVQLYNEGIVDFDIKVQREGQQIVLKAAPKKTEKKPMR